MRSTQLHTGTRSPADRTTASVRHSIFRELTQTGRPPIWAILGEYPDLVGYLRSTNVMPLHFADLKADMPGGIHRTAKFLEIPIDDAKWLTNGLLAETATTKSTATPSLF